MNFHKVPKFINKWVKRAKKNLLDPIFFAKFPSSEKMGGIFPSFTMLEF